MSGRLWNPLRVGPPCPGLQEHSRGGGAPQTNPPMQHLLTTKRSAKRLPGNRRREPLHHLRIGRGAIYCLLPLIRCWGEGVLFNGLPTTLVQFLQFSNDEVRGAPIREEGIPASPKAAIRGKARLTEHITIVELFREDLKHHAPQRVVFHKLPQQSRSSAIKIVIPMVKGPNPAAGTRQHVPSQDIEPETEHYVEIIGTQRIDCVRREAMHKALLDRNDIETRAIP